MKDSNQSDEDENNAAPTPLIENNNSDDDEPPATGAVMVEIDASPELEMSLAPTAEPNNRVKPGRVVRYD